MMTENLSSNDVERSGRFAELVTTKLETCNLEDTLEHRIYLTGCLLAMLDSDSVPGPLHAAMMLYEDSLYSLLEVSHDDLAFEVARMDHLANHENGSHIGTFRSFPVPLAYDNAAHKIVGMGQGKSAAGGWYAACGSYFHAEDLEVVPDGSDECVVCFDEGSNHG